MIIAVDVYRKQLALFLHHESALIGCLDVR